MDATLLPTLRAHLDRAELVAWTSSLVAAPSENPPGDERAVATVVEGLATTLEPRSLRRIGPSERRPSVVAEWGEGARTLIWNGHIDVVPVIDPGAWRHPPFEPVVVDGRLYGRGASDMKGSVAACLEGVALLARAGIRLGGRLVVQAVADEETGGEEGAQHLASAGLLDADAAIVGEPSELAPLVAAKGAYWGGLVVHGRSVHASRPQDGRNAVSDLARVIVALDELTTAGTHPLVGEPTLSVNTVEGGRGPNVVPDRAAATFDLRTLPGQDVAGIFAEIESVLERLRTADPGLDVRLERLSDSTASEISTGEEIVGVVQRAAELVAGVRPGVGGMTGATDARTLIAAGTPAVIFGPGSLAQAHTVDEWVHVDQLADAALCCALAFVEFLGAH